MKLMPDVFVAEVHDELVSLSDIAARTGVAHEAVRLWASGKGRTSLRPFPTPRQVVGSGPSGRAMALYAWREVVSWVREVLSTDPDEGIEYLDDRAIANLNAELAAIRSARPAAVRAENLVRSCAQQSCPPGHPALMITDHVPAVRLPPDHADDLVAAAVPA